MPPSDVFSWHAPLCLLWGFLPIFQHTGFDFSANYTARKGRWALFLPQLCGCLLLSISLSSQNTPEENESSSNINTASRRTSNVALTTVTILNKLVWESMGVSRPSNKSPPPQFFFRFSLLFLFLWLWMRAGDYAHSKMPLKISRADVCKEF